MAKFETIPVSELKTRIPGKLLPLVEDYRTHLEKLSSDQGGRVVIENRLLRPEPRPRRAGTGGALLRAFAGW